MQEKFYSKTGFTLIELMVVIGIIGILSTILYASFDVAKSQSRDKVRMASLKELQLAIEFYKAQNGVYPTRGCGNVGDFVGPGPVPAGGGSFASCDTYIIGLVPDFIPALPRDLRFENDAGKGYYYRSNGTSYKLMLLNVAEAITISSFDDDLARCPAQAGSCNAATPPATTYAVYSSGAESW